MPGSIPTRRGHLSSVRRVTFNQRTKQFISVDEHCLKAWTLDHDKQCRAQHDVQFPNYQSNFITSIVLSQELGLLFCACLDDNLRLYNERLRLKSSMPWSNGVVREVCVFGGWGWAAPRQSAACRGLAGMHMGEHGVAARHNWRRSVELWA